jgi:hypothetical protein
MILTFTSQNFCFASVASCNQLSLKLYTGFFNRVKQNLLFFDINLRLLHAAYLTPWEYPSSAQP